jgi:chloramphenicol 3-O-phosphotransferase
MAVLILTGPPGAGKNTIAAAYARQQARCAVIDVDLVRWMILQPHRAPWEGDEGRAQQRLGVQNACELARSFRAHGFLVVIHDVVSEETARLYRQELPGHEPKIVLLLPTFEEIVRRNALRPPRLTPEEIRAQYRSQAVFTDYDHTLDNTTLPPEEVAAQLARLSTTPG